MQRIHHGTPRPGWQAQILNKGLVFNDTLTEDGQVAPYWREGPYYAITRGEQGQLEEASRAMHQMCIEAGDYMIENPEVMSLMGIPESAWPEIIRTWNEEPPSIYGRFDWRFGGTPEMVAADPSLCTPKLLEYNADTPTSLLEASVIQWDWFEQAEHGGKDQWNNLHDALIAAWKRQIELLERRLGRKVRKIHFAHTAEETSGEDWMNTTYLADTAQQAGLEVKVFFIENLQTTIEPDTSFYFRDADGEYIDVLFKLYPWEWMTTTAMAASGKPSPTLPNGTVWVEPPYKQLWSNKGLLPVLWKLFKDDPTKRQYLLPAYFDNGQHGLSSYVRKPVLSREGANVSIYHNGVEVAHKDGRYGEEGYVVQAFAPLPNFQSPYTREDHHHPVMGVWIIDGYPEGLGIRESTSLITGNTSHFVPHVLVD